MLESMEELRAAVEGCTKCPLHETRNNVVFGQGNSNAEVLFIGEAPGQNEDEQGKAFVGRSGLLLDKMLAYVGLSRDHNIYISNIVKCRPPGNRDPLNEEATTCIDYLRNQVHIIRPKIIVCLGRVASTRIISPDFKVTQQHGLFYERGGVQIMGTFHPAALLRNPRQKPEAMEDFAKLKKLIGEICSPEYEQQRAALEQELL